MNLSEYNEFCASLPAASHVVQWGGSHVWKVGDGPKGKLFAVAGWQGGKDMPSLETAEFVYVTFKVSDLAFDVLKEQEGCRPAPYLASRGMKWIQCTGNQSLDDDALQEYLTESHRLVSLNLSKKKRSELGLAW